LSTYLVVQIVSIIKNDLPAPESCERSARCSVF